jgi:flagella basal body P-ring formation protein FlgA
MPITRFWLLACSLSFVTLVSPAAVAAPPAPVPPRQDLRLVHEAVMSFLHSQSPGLPGEVEITPGAIDSRLNLPACAALEAALPPGQRPWGNTTVTVYCSLPLPWTIYVRANIKVMANYIVSAKPLRQGQVLTAADLTTQRGDLAQLPPGTITELNEAVGRTLTGGLPFGGALRQDMLRARAAVVQNQSVKLVSSGRGFSVSAEGRALNNAAEGQMVQVRSASGSVVSGIARPGAIVEVNY